jgi:UDP-N-acetylglucosamine transferase subunit ALG13
MIFTLIGTHEQPFNRLVKMVDTYQYSQTKIIQIGFSTYVPQNCQFKQFFTFDEIVMFIKKADVVISQAGTGSVMLSLSLGKTPIVAPRYFKYGEHVDDHQVQLCLDLSEKGYIVPLYDGDDIKDKISHVKNLRYNKRDIEPDNRLLQSIRNIINS